MRCLARLAGLRDDRRCPLVIDEAVMTGGAQAYRARESCGGMGLYVDRATGQVVAVEYGRAIAGVAPASDP